MAVSSETPEASARLEAALGLRFPVLGDPELRVISAWRDEDSALGLAWPTVYLVDRDGRIAWFAVAEGANTIAEALRALRQLPP